MSITIKDIAKLANVSHTTVSRALNNSPLINEETKIKIKAIADRLNYVPNYSAKSLVLDKSYTIGLFFSSISKGTSPGFFFDTVTGVNSTIEEKYNLVIRGIDDYKDFTNINDKRFDGIILMSQSDNDNPFIYHVVEKGIPLVVLDRELDEKSLINIISDDKEGTFKAAEHLIKNGHKDIAIIEGKEEFKSTKRRKDGFMEALIQYNVPVHSEYIIKGNYSMKSGYNAMRELINLSKSPTAVVCSNDDMAVGAIKAVFDSGLQVPKDISIVGFDDIAVSEYTTPALTTVKRPIGEISIAGGKKLIEIMNKENYKGEKIYIKTEFIARDSVLNLNKNYDIK
ncbi:LacI family DNA-binding transcriptional regulator [Clostridium ljungdahlii]|uniref:Putative HTH-type transcriptional repressor ExuR n=1 Tax=Clostridium ljungdahlii TaxID=1538 RepID=A0A162KKI0_9CLOT|nr:LacI family DNA-binding transcriptional regulator [Clostridium ljungdahlii]OAA83512.1 putative HTH-type transcriptional repressor ExuR [Clostridium ljungdahlii]